MMMMQMGQKPSQKKINQMMTMMNKNQEDAMKKRNSASLKGDSYLLKVVITLIFVCGRVVAGFNFYSE